MIQRLSRMFVHTLREDPSDAEIKSHKLLVRAGYIRKVTAGIYTWLPFGLRVLKKVENIVREEMIKIGGTEILLPVLLGTEDFTQSGRLDKYGMSLFRLADRKNSELMLGPTHEETFTQLLKTEINSYKDLPQIIFQIQLKYRDEERPRAGIMRGREFLMKDSYSFDLSAEELSVSYAKHRVAYEKIFQRLGINYVIVKAFSGAMGGSISEEFLAETPVGEDTFAKSVDGKYAANVEAIVTPRAEPINYGETPSIQKIFTDKASTVDELVAWATNSSDSQLTTIKAHNVLKTLLYKVEKEGNSQIIAVGIPGDRDIDEKRLAVSLGTEDFKLLEAADFAKNPDLIKGYLGPMKILDLGIPYFVDPRVAVGSSWLVGADELGFHYKNCVVERDFTPTGTLEAVAIKEGDLAPNGEGTLLLARGVEIGHIFQLGDFYTNAFAFDVLGQDGKQQRVTMGSYGIGISRVIAVMAEQQATDDSLLWNYAVSPYDVHIVVANKDGMNKAEELAEQLSAEGYDVLLDDRKGSSGVKFKDAELIGIPRIIIVGRDWDKGLVEYRDRLQNKHQQVAISELAAILDR